MKKLAVISLSLIMSFAVLGCDNNMRNQPRYDPYEKSDFFDNGMASRPLVEGTVAQGYLREDDHLYRGKVDGKPAETFPFEITAEVLERGQERYDIFCSVCHDKLGYGRGMVVQRGFKQPPSYHEQRLKEAPVGYFYQVITNGFGAMYDFSSEIKPEDRWAIIAYIRTLQLSQDTPVESLTKEEKKQLDLNTKEQAGKDFFHGQP